MPLRNDQTAWWNLPGAVAAYQPVKAISPKMALYNMACGGNGKYSQSASVAPAWTEHTGWTFPGTAYLRSYIPVRDTWSLFVCSHQITSVDGYLFSSMNASEEIAITVGALTGNIWARIGNGSWRTFSVGVGTTLHTFAVSNGLLYLDGNYVTTTTASKSVTATRNSFGSNWPGYGPYNLFNGTIKAAAIYDRAVSAAEAYTVSRQMAYCNVNPDWSVWGRRRRWYYDSVLPTFQAAWAAHSNAQIGTGVN